MRAASQRSKVLLPMRKSHDIVVLIFCVWIFVWIYGIFILIYALSNESQYHVTYDIFTKNLILIEYIHTSFSGSFDEYLYEIQALCQIIRLVYCNVILFQILWFLEWVTLLDITMPHYVVEKHCLVTYLHVYTGWPRKNATTLIVNFKDIITKTELIFILLCGKFIFQQNDTMIINFG